MNRMTDEYLIGSMEDYSKEKEVIEFFDTALKVKFPFLNAEELVISESMNIVSIRISYPIEINDEYREMISYIDREIVRLKEKCNFLY